VRPGRGEILLEPPQNNAAATSTEMLHFFAEGGCGCSIARYSQPQRVRAKACPEVDRRSQSEIGDGLMSWLILIVSIASIPLAVKMARERDRSPKVWFWIAFLVGPLAPLVLLMLGEARRRAPAN
jgi:hypothetical protein